MGGGVAPTVNLERTTSIPPPKALDRKLYFLHYIRRKPGEGGKRPPLPVCRLRQRVDWNPLVKNETNGVDLSLIHI